MTKYSSPHAEIKEHHMGFWITLYKSSQIPAGGAPIAMHHHSISVE
jgi:hypothetical protein